MHGYKVDTKLQFRLQLNEGELLPPEMKEGNGSKKKKEVRGAEKEENREGVAKQEGDGKNRGEGKKRGRVKKTKGRRGQRKKEEGEKKVVN